MQWWPRKQPFYLVGPPCSVQGRFHLPEQLTINVLGQLTAILLEQESHTAPFILSIHSPDNVFMVPVSVFISTRNVPLSCSVCNHYFMTYWNIEHNTLKTYVRMYGCTTPSLCLGTLVPRQKTRGNTWAIPTFLNEMGLRVGNGISPCFFFWEVEYVKPLECRDIETTLYNRTYICMSLIVFQYIIVAVVEAVNSVILTNSTSASYL